jgi:hypothetical protein
MAPKSPPSTGFDRLKAWLVGLTGVLVVVPALVNGAIDVYSAFAKLPKTESERLNVELFKKYFNKQPVAAFPVPIKQNNGTVEVRFSVFDEGDVFVEFGKYTQWFPFPNPSSSKVSLALISEAYAQDAGQLRGFGKFTQMDSYIDGLVTRERKWDNGVLETIRLDPRTGDVIDVNARQTTPIAPEGSSNQTVQPRISEFAPIDLDAIRTQKSRPSSRLPSLSPTTFELTSTCFSQSGPCHMVSPIPVKSQCVCYGPYGVIPGVAK